MLKLRRPDWLEEMHGFLLIALVISGLGVLAAAGYMLTGQPVDIEVATGGALGSTALTGLPPGTSLDSPVHLEVTDPTTAQSAWAAAAVLPRLLLVTTALFLLWRLVGRARRHGPFAGEVPGRFRVLGLLLVLGGPLVWLLDFGARTLLSNSVPGGETYAVLDFSVPVIWGLCGFAMFTVGEIVRRGEVMRADLDGVV